MKNKIGEFVLIRTSSLFPKRDISVTTANISRTNLICPIFISITKTSSGKFPIPKIYPLPLHYMGLIGLIRAIKTTGGISNDSRT